MKYYSSLEILNIHMNKLQYGMKKYNKQKKNCTYGKVQIKNTINSIMKE